MPDVTVSADVDSMLRSANDAAIRTAIGLGQTDAPTFLKSTAYDATSSVLNLNGFQLGSPIYTGKHGLFSKYGSSSEGWTLMSGGATQISGTINWPGPWVTQHIGFAPTSTAIPTTFLWEDGAPGILAQRNGTAKQTLRIYNTYTSATVYERAVMDWNGPTPGNLQIGTEFLGSGSGMAARPIDFVTGGVVRMSIGAAGGVTVSGDLIGSNSVRIGSGAGQVSLFVGGSGILRLVDTSFADFGRLQLGGTTSAFPAIKRNGTGIDIRLADDSNFAPLSSGALTIAGGGANITGIVNGTAFISGFYIQTNTQFMFGTGGVGDVALQKNATGVVEINSTTAGTFRDLRCRSVIQQPPATITPASNGDLVVEATSNTLLTFKFKGSDGTVRSGTMVVA